MRFFYTWILLYMGILIYHGVGILAGKNKLFMNSCRYLGHEYYFLNAIVSYLILKKDIIAPYGWISTVLRLQSHYYDTGCSGVILGQNCVRLSDAALNDLFFFKNLFYRKQCKYAVYIGLLKSKVPFKCF